MKYNQFDNFTERDKGLLSTALFMAIEQWSKDAVACPELAIEFNFQIRTAEDMRESIGY